MNYRWLMLLLFIGCSDKSKPKDSACLLVPDPDYVWQHFHDSTMITIRTNVQNLCGVVAEEWFRLKQLRNAKTLAAPKLKGQSCVA